MMPDGLADLLAGAAAFGRSLEERFDPGRFLAEFSARAQRVVPHDLVLIARWDGNLSQKTSTKSKWWPQR